MNIPVPQINALFAPRPPIEYIPPIDVQLKRKKRSLDSWHGMAACTEYFETGQEYDEIMKKWKPIEQRPERRERIQRERKEMCDETLAEKAAAWDPSSYSFETDAYKTLFIARLSYMTDEHKVKREMEQVRILMICTSSIALSACWLHCVCVRAFVHAVWTHSWASIRAKQRSILFPNAFNFDARAIAVRALSNLLLTTLILA